MPGWKYILFSAAAAVSAAPAQSPRAVVEGMFAAFNRNDVAALEAYYAEDVRLTSSDFCAPRVGKAGVRRTYAALFETFPGITDKVEALVVEGERVAVRFAARSTAPGREFTLPIMTFLTVRDGLIRTDDSIFDTKGEPCSQ
jgi:ketosteroid isomerase-like protein